MIKANELRIGNRVLVDRLDDDEPWETIVEEIEPYQITVALIPRGGTWVKPDEIEPITLTAEWLAKMGFVWDESRYDGETRIVRKGCLELHHDEDQPKTGYSIALFDDGNIAFAGHDIRYVHQLQNLYFALTGEELEIKT